MSSQRRDFIYKRPVFAASLFFIHTFVFRIFKKTVLGRMSTVSPVSKTQIKPEYGVLFEIAKSVYVQTDERPSEGVNI